MRWIAGCVSAALLVLAGLAVAAEAPLPEPVEPTTIKSLAATPLERSAVVRWSADAPAGATGWVVQWAGPSSIQGQMVLQQMEVDAAKRECVVNDLKPGRIYMVTVLPSRKEKDGKLTMLPLKEPRQIQIRVGKLGAKLVAPKGLSAVADGPRVLVSWQSSEERNVGGYQVLRKGPDDSELKPYLTMAVGVMAAVQMAAPNGRPVQPVSPSAFLDAGLTENVKYEYAVRAVTTDATPEYSPMSATAAVETKPFVTTPQSLLIVMNVKAPGAAGIATHYVQVRRIEKPAMVRVAVPVGAEITRADYEKLLLKPVREYLAVHPEVTNILLIRGVPWRITESPQGTRTSAYMSWDRAGVDSELTLARFDDYPIAGRIPNPLYGRAVHLTPVDRVLAVCRLDAPDDKLAAALVDRAVDAEKRGVEGIAFFDARGLKGGAYMMGDVAIRKAAELMKADGRMKVEIEDTEKNVDISTKGETIGFYYGWYTANFRPVNKAFRFGRGAIGAHLHSYAGTAIAVDKSWVGEMIDHGATAVLGVATEPLLDGFPTADGLVDALLKGCPFGEASLSASRYLSWMPMVLGDPLYRPFKAMEKPKGPAGP